MGISTSLPIPTNPPVLPGTAVKQSVYTNAGFTAGDYVYRYNGNSVGALPYFTTGVSGPTITTIIAGTKYNFTYGTGTPFSRSDITSPIAVPSTYTLTTPIATSMGSTYLAQQNISTYAAPYGPRCALLTNGNVVVLYISASGILSYKIYNTSGTSLYSGDIATGVGFNGWSNSYEGAYDVCGLNAGGFAITYSDANTGYWYVKTYNSIGTNLLSSAPLSTTGYTPGAICADTSDILYTVNTAGTGTSVSTNIYRFTSALAISASTASSVGPNYYTPPKITYSLSGNLGVCYDGAATLYYYLYSPSTLTAISGTNNTFSKGTYTKMSCCPSLETNGGVFFASMYSSTVNIGYAYLSSYVNYTTFTSDANTSGYGSTNIFPAYITTAGANDGTSNSIIVYYTGNTSQSSVFTKIANLASNRSTWTAGSSSYATPFTATTNSANSGSTCVCATGTASGFIAGRNSSNYNGIALSGTFTYALSASVATPATAQPTPPNGYSLIGVATTTAAAGSYGSVVINGTVSLASTYATSSTAYGFNFNATNGYGFLGNKGYVVNRVVTLQGLE